MGRRVAHRLEPRGRSRRPDADICAARHVAFGRLALRDHYPQLTDAERRERVQKLYTGFGVIRYADKNPQEMLDHDAQVGEEFDRLLGRSPAIR